MEVHKSVYFLTKFLIIILIAALAGTAGWFLLQLNLDTSGPEREFQMTRLNMSAKQHFDRFKDYEAVCGDIGIPTGWICDSNATSYAVEVGIGGGRFYCGDSKGFVGETRISKGEGTVCRDY